MNTALFIRILATILFLALLHGCGPASEKRLGAAFLIDRSEDCSATEGLTEEAVASALGIRSPREQADAVTVLVTEISGGDMEPIGEIAVEGMARLANRKERGRAVEEFVGEVAAALADTSTGCGGRSATSIYKPLRAMAARMREGDFTERVIHLLSDGQENSAGITLPRDDRSLKARAKGLAEALRREHGELGDLTGISFVLVFQPDGERGIGALEFWRDLLLENGAESVELRAAL